MILLIYDLILWEHVAPTETGENIKQNKTKDCDCILSVTQTEKHLNFLIKSYKKKDSMKSYNHFLHCLVADSVFEQVLHIKQTTLV